MFDKFEGGDFKHDNSFLKTLAEILGTDIWFQEPRPRIWELVYKSRLKSSARYQDSRPIVGRERVSGVLPDIWNSDIRHDVVTC